MQVNSLNHIADLVESCIGLQEISSNPRLVTILAYYGFLPLQELIASLKNIKISLDDAIQACSVSSTLKHIFIAQPVPGLFVPYQVIPATLILSNVPIKCTLEKLKAFIKELSGTDEFELEKNQNDQDIPTYSVRFKTIETSVYFWRALKYVPFDGSFISVTQKIIAIEPKTPKNNHSHKNQRFNRSKNNRYRRNRSSSSDDNDNDNFTYNNNYRSQNSQKYERKSTLQVIKRKDYLKKAPTITIQCPRINNK